MRPVADRTEKTSYVRPQERENAFQLLYTDFPDLPNSGAKSKAVDTEYGDASSESNEELLATQSADSASANSHPVTSTDVPQLTVETNTQDNISPFSKTQENQINVTSPSTTAITEKELTGNTTETNKT